jgi:hypothetical protein
LKRDEERGETVDAGDLDHLDEVVGPVLRVAERSPRKADEEPAPQPLERDPQRGGEPDRRHVSVLEPPNAGDERAVVARERARHQHEDGDRDGERHARVPRDRVRDPVRGGEVEHDSREPSEAKRRTRPDARRREQHGHETDPCERLEVERGERRREKESARRRHQEARTAAERPLRRHRDGRAVVSDR